MKDFEEMITEVLKERKKLEKEQQELAENIIGTAIKEFANISVESVHIEIDSSKDNQIAIYAGEKENAQVTHVCNENELFDVVRDILSSEDDKINKYFDIGMNSESILLRLKYKKAWTKKGGNIHPFFAYIRK